ncbi:hypothetical protein ABKN59_003910 [Abortiporus biennis]
MHALSHTLAHRGPTASRARARWQPYTSTITTPHTPNYLNTPASSLPFTPPTSTIIKPICNSDRLRKLAAHSSHPQSHTSSQSGQLREVQKNQYVTRLVDQAVKSLCDIWQPDDIPTIFRTTSKTAFVSSSAGETNALPQDSSIEGQQPSPPYRHNTQLPSPISPTTRPSPCSPSPSTDTDEATVQDNCSNSQLVPIKGFVYEVLRRSRTSAGVLQTALCYLEAVRSKVPELLRKEKMILSGELSAELEADRIVMGDISEFAQEDVGTNCPTFPDMVPTVRVITDDASLEFSESSIPLLAEPISSQHPSRKISSISLPPLPPLPSPLLCPRRTFLACLILASKFMQDRSYSNRAWAKLAGLPPREIGRCERALGEILEWRLWVGKAPEKSTPSSSRALGRCKSEADLSHGPSPQVGGFLVQQPSSAWNPTPVRQSGLRRSATVPNLDSERSTLSAASTSTTSLPTPSSIFDELDSLLLEPSSTISLSAQQTPTYTASPSLSTPSLSFSPMSTVSTSSDEGDRTIQVPSFVDMPISESAHGHCETVFSDFDVIKMNMDFTFEKHDPRVGSFQGNAIYPGYGMLKADAPSGFLAALHQGY